MKYSELFPKTKKDAPKDEVSINAKFLMRGGFIDKLMAGSYTLLPLGRRVERKIEQIIREEMDKTGAQEVLMPLLHPKEIWNETGRWDSAKEVMYQFKKNEKEYALSFTHEEIVMDLLRKNISSYKDLPVKIYHFSTKFRNEARARSGILRGREFLMKDLYSAHTTQEDMSDYYWKVSDAYMKVFERMGLSVKIVEAAGGVFTDAKTHEYQVICETGEDTIYHCESCTFAQNKEIVTVKENETCPQCKKGTIKLSRSIEVGNIFPLGTMYSEKMGVYYTAEDGTKKPVWFASYGIGPTRLVGTLVEVFHDDKGILWPQSVSPFNVHLISLNKNANSIYNTFLDAGIDVLYDDRTVGAGEKFADADLIGIPVRLVVSEKTGDKVELKMRDNSLSELLSMDEVLKRIKPGE